MAGMRVLLLLALLWGARAGAEATSDSQPTASPSGDPVDVRFHVPFAAISMQGLDLESLSAVPPDLRVKRTLADSEAACEGAATSYPSVKATDRLLSVDGVPISLMTFQEVIDMAVGTTVMLPLFKATQPGLDGNTLTGFARVEIVRPTSVEFQPTTPERVRNIQAWQAAIALKRQQELEKEQEERERIAAAENDKLEQDAREKREKEEQYRLEMTPHDRVAVKRRDGKEFRFEVLFTTRGPIGLNWELLTTDRTVVSHLEPKLPAETIGVIAPKDQLIQLNDVDTTDMAPADVVSVYVQSTPPRRMVFRCSGSATTSTTAGVVVTAEAETKIQNWTIVFESPAILSGWKARLHLATWSQEPTQLTNQTLRLTTASPVTGCQVLPIVQDGAYLAYRGGCSFVDKAQNALKSNARLLIVVNNLKGEGRFPAKMPDVQPIELVVTMIGKLEGELVMSVREHEPDLRFRVYPEVPSDVPSLLPPVPPPKLTNEEMVFRRDPKKAARAMTFWYINTTAAASASLHPAVSSHAVEEFRVLPALFGGNVTSAPFRIVMAYPQETACHPQGLGVLATRSVILVKRGGCSFGMKASAVQAVGGVGMLMINTDESLIPLMSDPRETAKLTIWAASIGLQNGTFIQEILARNKNLPTLVKVASVPLVAPPA